MNLLGAVMTALLAAQRPASIVGARPQRAQPQRQRPIGIERGGSEVPDEAIPLIHPVGDTGVRAQVGLDEGVGLAAAGRHARVGEAAREPCASLPVQDPEIDALGLGAELLVAGPVECCQPSRPVQAHAEHPLGGGGVDVEALLEGRPQTLIACELGGEAQFGLAQVRIDEDASRWRFHVGLEPGCEVLRIRVAAGQPAGVGAHHLQILRMQAAVIPQVLGHRVPIGAQGLGQIAVGQQRAAEFAADACQYRCSERIGRRQRPSSAVGLGRPCLHLVGREAVQHVTRLLLAVGVPAGLETAAEEIALTAAGELGQVGEHLGTPRCQLGQLGFPTLHVEGQTGALHAVEKGPGCLLQSADLLQPCLSQPLAQHARHPQGFDGVGCGIGNLAITQRAIGPEGKLRRGLAFDAQAEVALGGPGQSVKEAEPGQPLMQQSIGQLRIPPAQRPDGCACRCGRLHEMSVDDPIVKRRVPGIRCQIRHPETLVQRCCQLHQVVRADIDDPRAFGSVGRAGCCGDHPQLRHEAARLRVARLKIRLGIHRADGGRRECVDEVAELVAAHDRDGNLSWVSRCIGTRVEPPEVRWGAGNFGGSVHERTLGRPCDSVRTAMAGVASRSCGMVLPGSSRVLDFDEIVG